MSVRNIFNFGQLWEGNILPLFQSIIKIVPRDDCMLFLYDGVLHIPLWEMVLSQLKCILSSKFRLSRISNFFILLQFHSQKCRRIWQCWRVKLLIYTVPFPTLIMLMLSGRTQTTILCSSTVFQVNIAYINTFLDLRLMIEDDYLFNFFITF